MPKIKVSNDTYNELYEACTLAGYKLGENVTSLTIDKDTSITNVINFRLVTMRRDVADIASKTYQHDTGVKFVDYVNELYEFILNGKAEVKPKTGW